MRVVIQRAKDASVTVEKEVVGTIENGLLLLVSFTHDDTTEDINYMIKKIPNMRIFEDSDGKMNLNVVQKGFDILSVSQFTLYAETKKGNRPGFSNSMKPDDAKKMYHLFNKLLSEVGLKVEEGIFGASMDVKFTNDGPVTIILDSKNR